MFSKLFRKYRVSVIALLSCMLVNTVVFTYFEKYTYTFYINWQTFILILIFLYIVGYIKGVLNKSLLLFWLYIYECGILFLNSAAINDPKLNISNLNADNFYLTNLIALALGILCSEKVFAKRLTSISVGKAEKFPLPFALFLYLYPFLFFISTYSKLGVIPMLIGDSIIDKMYNYDYGVIYGYKYFIIISTLLVLYNILTSKKWKLVGSILIILFSLLSLMDGKRAILLISIISVITLYFLFTKKYSKPNIKFMAAVLSITAFLYVSLAIVRSGRKNELININAIIEKFPVGVEYTDYAYSFERFPIGHFKNYSFLASSLGSLLNSGILEIFGYDKDQLVKTGSAYVWMKEYGIDLGIRTGIFCELYFDYGYWTFLLVFIMGFYFDFINRKIFSTKKLFSFLILVSIFGFNVLLIVGQATVYFGTITLIFYLYLLYKCILLVTKKKIKRERFYQINYQK